MQRLVQVEAESIPAPQAAGRVLSSDLLADRDSPASSVSAMDGYALRFAELTSGKPCGIFQIAAVVAAGTPAPPLPPGQAIKLFTGAPVPSEADIVIKREDTSETASRVTINLAREEISVGQHIRPQGENIRCGTTVLPAGTVLTPQAMVAVAAFGRKEVHVFRKLKVVVLNTGDELAEMGDPVAAWQIRDSNGPFLESWLANKPWIEFLERRRVADTLDCVSDQLQECCEIADAVILTGGVSMGDADYVPDAIRSLGGEIVFHRLPIRPGKPVLGAHIRGKLLLGLPGNPVSVGVTARTIGLPLLEHMAGRVSAEGCELAVVNNPDSMSAELVWFRLVERDLSGGLRLVESRGSGDLVSLAKSVGFVEFPASQTGAGPWRFYRW
ncbi:MAG: molybdopterin molybdotransferase MoeA [Planctomycetales bacterium]|nr:molybdopterin molybdotransferase MoeA [Planctomycetales bacterium]